MKQISAVYVNDVSLLGDKLISDTSIFLLKKALDELGIASKITLCGLFLGNGIKLPKIKLKKHHRMLLHCLTIKVFKLGLNFNLIDAVAKNIKFVFDFLYWLYRSNSDAEIKNYYQDMVKNSDLIFFSGGGIFHHSYINIWCAIYSIVECAKKYNKNIYFHASGFDSDVIFLEKMLYKYLLSRKVVKAVTTRDDIDFLQQLLNAKKVCKRVLDSAFWTKECYAIEPVNENIIGIGVIRPRIFIDNGIFIKKEKVVELYCGMIIELEKRGYRWQIFSNGSRADFRLGEEILQKLNKDAQYLAPRPQTAEELLNTIKKFKGVIAARLHANIPAVSLGIPTVGIVWSNKLLHFQKIIKSPATFITKDKFDDAAYVVDELEKALKAGIDAKNIENLKEYSFEVLKNSLSDIFSAESIS